MTTRGKYTREEICSQPESWRQALEVLEMHYQPLMDFSRLADYQQIIFTGCGSSYYLSLAAATTFQEMTGLKAIGMPASEIWLSPGGIDNAHTTSLLIAISRSGETTETIMACDHFGSSKRGDIITLTCYPESKLGKMGVLNLVFPSGMERSVAQTRAFSTLYLGAVGVGLIWSHQKEGLNQLDQLATIGEHIIGEYWPTAQEYGQNLETDRIYFLGSGGRYGLACELNLKMKEMSLTHSEAFHFLEFRHGPKAMANSQTLIVGLVSEKHAGHEKAVLEDVEKLGAKIIAIGESNADISFNSGLEEVKRNILYLPFGQIMAYERAIAKGLDPDRPQQLDPVVILSS